MDKNDLQAVVAIVTWRDQHCMQDVVTPADCADLARRVAACPKGQWPIGLQTAIRSWAYDRGILGMHDDTDPFSDLWLTLSEILEETEA